MPTTPLPEASASLSTSSPSTSRTRSIDFFAGQIHAQALSVKVLPMSMRLRPTSFSSSGSLNSGKHLDRLILATSRERLGSFHISQPIAVPVHCTARHGNSANNRNAPTITAPLNLSTDDSQILEAGSVTVSGSGSHTDRNRRCGP